jgi:hypothetical protein
MVYKREYENMIQSKDDTIKRMSLQGDEQFKKNTEAKDKLITELKKQSDEVASKFEQQKAET